MTFPTITEIHAKGGKAEISSDRLDEISFTGVIMLGVVAIESRKERPTVISFAQIFNRR